MLRHKVNQAILDLFETPSYLEVGVEEGNTFHAVGAARKVAVDPHFLFDATHAAQAPANAHSEYHEVRSDRYFAQRPVSGQAFDVVFLDGLHTIDQTLRDFVNTLACLGPKGVIIVDDVIPSTYAASIPDPVRFLAYQDKLPVPDGTWMGDVYRLVFFIRDYMPFFEYATVEENHGQMVVWHARRNTRGEPPATVEAIARLEFLDAVLRKSAFPIQPFADILAALRAR